MHASLHASLDVELVWKHFYFVLSGMLNPSSVLNTHINIRYDTIYLHALKNWLLASLVKHTKQKKQKKSNGKTKNKSRVRTTETVAAKVRAVSPWEGRESTVGKVCKKLRYPIVDYRA